MGHRARGLQRATAMPGLISRTITRAAAPIAGARTGLPGLATTSSISASVSRCGTSSDPILKERLFGLTNSEGNHGEDVKELYYYLDATPSHSWMRMLYKYPQAAFPYAPLVEENRRRGTNDPEFELLDTGVFDGDRYFDVEITYAKAAPDDILMEIVATNRGPDPAPLHILPQLWARNTWSWKPGVAKPMLRRTASGEIVATRPRLPAMRLICDGAPELLFCENETNARRLWGQEAAGYFKDGDQRLCRRRRRRRGQSGRVRHQGRGALQAADPRRRLGPRARCG